MSTASLAASSKDLTNLQVNILVVDDEPRNLAVLETVLDDPSYRLVRAGSGNEALLKLVADEFAVLVLDVRMPDMTGFELANMVRERRKTAQIPIIFLTAYYNEDQHILEGYTSGAVDYLHKPVNPAVLRSKVAIFAELHKKSLALARANSSLVLEIAERRRTETLLHDLNTTLDRRITERTEALHASESRLKEVDKRKDEFLATLAHELRNPLAPMRNAVQILQLKAALTPETQWASEIIERQIRAMSRLVDDLMDAARINQGRIDLRLERVDLSQILRDAIEACQSFIDDCAHQLSAPIGVAQVHVDADPIRLAQAFTNLLHNAAKYMNHGGRIELQVQQLQGEAVVTIRDSGIGIAEDRLQSIFEMFSQVESALERSRGGLGIGLALTQRLVELHGGRIHATSAGLGQGSVFEVRLPLVHAHLSGEDGIVITDTDAADEKTRTPLRILIADDNMDSASTLAFLLEAMGHTVCQAHDGCSAVRKAVDFDPHLVLLDIGMPVLNGYEVCRQLRSLPGGSERHIVAVTGWGQPGDRLLSQQAGFNKHLVKPLGQEDFEEVIAAVYLERQPQ